MLDPLYNCQFLRSAQIKAGQRAMYSRNPYLSRTSRRLAQSNREKKLQAEKLKSKKEWKVAGCHAWTLLPLTVHGDLESIKDDGYCAMLCSSLRPLSLLLLSYVHFSYCFCYCFFQRSPSFGCSSFSYFGFGFFIFFRLCTYSTCYRYHS